MTTFISLAYSNISKDVTGEFREINEPQNSSNLIVYQNAEGLKNITMQNLQEKINQTKALADIFATRIDKITDLLETTSRYPTVRNIS
ncbi:MAG TPA: hypothetical protein VIA09_01190, partial [Nitrososphaeraceae archaeon]